MSFQTTTRLEPALSPPPVDRAPLVRRSRLLTSATLAYNSLEAVIAIVAGVAAGSVALIGFGVDSAIELSASVVALWRLSADIDPERRQHAERVSHQLIGFSFIALAIYVAIDAGLALLQREVPSESRTGIGLALASLVVMPLLARAKRGVARQLGSRALAAEAQQTALCTWLSAILLGGLVLNAWLCWWWADPIAALAMVPIIAREGVEGVRGEPHCDDGCR